MGVFVDTGSEAMIMGFSLGGRSAPCVALAKVAGWRVGWGGVGREGDGGGGWRGVERKRGEKKGRGEVERGGWGLMSRIAVGDVGLGIGDVWRTLIRFVGVEYMCVMLRFWEE